MKYLNQSWRLLTGGVVVLALLACNKPGASSEASSAPASQPTPAVAEQSPTKSPEDLMARTKAEDAMKLVSEGKAVIVDVRGSEPYKASHIKGALDFPLSKMESGDFKGLPNDKQIISYCT